MRKLDIETVKKLRSSLIKFLLFLILTSLFISIHEDVSADSIKTEKWVFIGDSYSSKGKPKQTIPVLTAKMYGLKTSQYNIECCKGGQGLIGWKEGKEFSLRLDKNKKDKKVTKVIIIGGINNDGGRSRKSLKKAADQFFKLVKEKYPKAKIYYTIPNWYANYTVSRKHKKEKIEAFQKNQRKVETRLQWYQEFCKEHHVIFLTDSTYVLHMKKNVKYFAKDGHHPGIKGRKKIAKVLAKELKRKRSQPTKYVEVGREI